MMTVICCHKFPYFQICFKEEENCDLNFSTLVSIYWDQRRKNMGDDT